MVDIAPGTKLINIGPLFGSDNLNLNHSRMTKLSDLDQYVGKVLKYTKDNGATWTYYLIEKPLYGVNDRGIAREAFKASTQEKRWLGHQVFASSIIDEDFFDECLTGTKDAYFSTATFNEFKDIRFSGHNYLQPHQASRNLPSPNLPNPRPTPSVITCRAPLTLIRSEKQDINIDVQVVFNNTFVPTQPTFPNPSSIDKVDETETHTWKLHVNHSQNLSTADHQGLVNKIKMIWWEALRKSDPKPVNVQDSTCIKGNEIESFLKAVLTKKGIEPSEQEAFIDYWKETFRGQEDSYLQVRLVQDDEISSLLPEMKIKSDDAKFELKRLYFQFVPVAQLVTTNTQTDYINGLSEEKLGKNTVIDLGAEIINANGSSADLNTDNAFNQRFAEKHIFA